jgi:uncharacterized phage protein (TIGR02220 family)
MSWLKMEHSLPEKIEVVTIAAELAMTPDEVIGKLFKVWRWFDQHTTDGRATIKLNALALVVGVDVGFLDQMHLAGWLYAEGADVVLPNFDYHCGETAKTRALAAKRKQKQRANDVKVSLEESRGERDKSVTREEKRREEEKIVEQVLGYLNAKAGRNYKPVEANAKFVRARLADGFTLDDMTAVIDAKVLEWKGGEMDQYLRPATLFNAEKFAQYHGAKAAGGKKKSSHFAGGK